MISGDRAMAPVTLLPLETPLRVTLYLYCPVSLGGHIALVERVEGIEPSLTVWKTVVLTIIRYPQMAPFIYTRMGAIFEFLVSVFCTTPTNL